MPSQIETLGLGHLSAKERLSLIDELWDSVGGAEAEAKPLCDEAKTEIDRRLAAHAADPSRAVPWEVVETEALERLRRMHQ